MSTTLLRGYELWIVMIAIEYKRSKADQLFAFPSSLKTNSSQNIRGAYSVTDNSLKDNLIDLPWLVV
jgi:hypothetical protein